MGIGLQLDAVSLDILQQRFATGEKEQPQLAGAHTHHNVYLLSIINHALGDHRLNRDLTTTNSLLWEIKRWYILPVRLHLPDDRSKRWHRFALVEGSDIVRLCPWLMA